MSRRFRDRGIENSARSPSILVIQADVSPPRDPLFSLKLLSFVNFENRETRAQRKRCKQDVGTASRPRPALASRPGSSLLGLLPGSFRRFHRNFGQNAFPELALRRLFV
jgi:hypothetical protein